MNETTLIYISFGVSLVLTGSHLAEEYVGRLWHYFGAIAGVPIPDWLGISVFSVGLGGTLVFAAVGILGIAGRFDMYWLSLVGVGFLLGGRISDWWNSHFKLQKQYKWKRGFRGNPGFLSSWLYLADAVLLIYLLWAFKADWTADMLWPLGLVGLVAGVGLFIVVIPGIIYIGNKWFSQAVQPKWKPHQPIPDWVTE